MIDWFIGPLGPVAAGIFWAIVTPILLLLFIGWWQSRRADKKAAGLKWSPWYGWVPRDDKRNLWTMLGASFGGKRRPEDEAQTFLGCLVYLVLLALILGGAYLFAVLIRNR